MKLPFLDRDEETARLARLMESPEGSLAVLYGRRRCGKSRPDPWSA
jgi:AAA+ ATPase superfamily predicted ATPase